MPSFLELLGDNDIAWRDINKLVDRYVSKAKIEVVKNNGAVKKEATFYTIINHKINGLGEADAQYDFYNELFKSLNETLSKSEKKLIPSILKKILMQPDKDYLNFIGELSTLLFYKINTPFKLLKVEEQISNNRNISADFLFQNPEDEMKILVEVVNIHLANKTDLSDNFLSMHINRKLEIKKETTLINPDRKILVQPFLWLQDFNQLQRVSEFYSKFEFQPEKTMIPLCYASFLDNKGEYDHHIDLMTVLLEKGMH